MVEGTLLAILDHFFIYENGNIKPNLPKNIQYFIRQGIYGPCFSVVIVAAEIKKRYPLFFDEVCTNEFKQVTE